MNGLYPEILGDKFHAWLTCYVPDGIESVNRKKHAVLVCPGGGYNIVSNREGEPVALRYAAAGFNAYVLDYSTKDRYADAYFPTQLLQGFAAVDYIRNNAGEHDTDKLAVCGFSAGGHLAASLGTLYDSGIVKEKFKTPGNLRVDAMILCYTVLTADKKYCHAGSVKNLLGDNGAKYLKYLSLEKNVNKNTPRTFLMHSADDGTVPVENSLLFADALAENKVPFELHIFEKGVHGIALGDKITASARNGSHINPDMAKWVGLSISFLEKM